MNELFKTEGRINRKKFIIRSLIYFLIWFFLTAIVLSFSDSLAGFVFMGYLVIQSFLVVRRLHDIGKPGHYYWTLLIPLYNIYLGILLLFKKGTEGRNQYDEDSLNQSDEKEKNIEEEVATPPTPPKKNESKVFENKKDAASGLDTPPVPTQESGTPPPAPSEEHSKNKSPEPPVGSNTPESEGNKVEAGNRSTQTIDINTAPEEVLADLYGIGPIIAKKIITYREENRGFNSFTEFKNELDLKSHISDELENRVEFSEIIDEEPEMTGRVIDF